MSIIQVEDVSMRFNLAQEKTETLKEYTVKLLKHQLFFNEFYAPHDGQCDRQWRDRAPDRAGRGL